MTYVDQLDALRITNESLYYVPFATLPHMWVENKQWKFYYI
jgi:hypothetical protein